jgi:hypothetical protein
VTVIVDDPDDPAVTAAGDVAEMLKVPVAAVEAVTVTVAVPVLVAYVESPL